MRLIALFLVLCSASGMLQGADYPTIEEMPGQLSIESANWEVGLGGGYAFVQNSPIITQTTTNIFAPYGFPDSWVVVETKGKVHNAVALEAYVYRRITPALSLGLEGNFQFEHKIDAEIQGTSPILGPDYVTSHYEIFEITPAAKLSSWLGQTQMYLVAAPGIASVHQQSRAHYVFGGEEYFSGNQDSQHWYFVAKLGGGLDYALSDEGSIGVDLRYHVICMASHPLKMLVPTLHAAYHF